MRRGASRAWRFARGHAVLSLSALAAFVTACFVPPDVGYIDYVDVRTIACLFSILAVATALKRSGAFESLARVLVRRFSSSASVVSMLVCVTCVLSMVATNDMALIMMLPLAAATLVRAGWTNLLPFTFAMLALTANLGGMIAPFGNPQNLYLYSYFEIQLSDFLATMAFPFALSMAMVALCCVVALRNPIAPRTQQADSLESAPTRPDPRRVAAYLVAFVAAVALVLRLLPPVLVVALVVAILLITDRRALGAVDYPLLATFVCFFVFSGNMARIPVVDDFVSSLVALCPLVASAGLSQVISNVPAAVLLSHFTDAWQSLLIGVNIGGAGTPVGSLASLIALQQYQMVSKLRAVRSDPSASTQAFLRKFCLYNFGFLLVLVAACSLVGASR